MDYLPSAVVRTDPIINQNGLSSHVHTFFGVTEARPSATFDDLRSAYGNTGNVVENKSLYWFPSIYRYHPDTNLYTLADIWYISAYYTFPPGETAAFPEGFRMIAKADVRDRDYSGKQFAECVSPGPCPEGDCSTLNSFFPATACGELEMSFEMPDCWDGVSLDSENHMDHVTYSVLNRDEEVADCPESHPVRIPRILVFVRILNYPGGMHLFSDGSGVFHADYVSGWIPSELQNVLDNCDNGDFGANPVQFCAEYLTFLDAPKDGNTDKDIAEEISVFQPAPYDTSSITTEPVNYVSVLPGNPLGVDIETPPASTGIDTVLLVGDSWASDALGTLGANCASKASLNQGVEGAWVEEFANMDDCCNVFRDKAAIDPANRITHVFLSLGGNDFRDEGCEAPLPSVQKHLRTVIEQLTAAYGVPVIVTGYGAPSEEVWECSAAQLLQLQSALASAAQEAGATFVDVYGWFKASPSDAFSDPRFFADELRLNAAGYARLWRDPALQSAFECQESTATPTPPPTPLPTPTPTSAVATVTYESLGRNTACRVGGSTEGFEIVRFGISKRQCKILCNEDVDCVAVSFRKWRSTWKGRCELWHEKPSSTQNSRRSECLLKVFE